MCACVFFVRVSCVLLGWCVFVCWLRLPALLDYLPSLCICAFLFPIYFVDFWPFHFFSKLQRLGILGGLDGHQFYHFLVSRFTVDLLK